MESLDKAGFNPGVAQKNDPEANPFATGQRKSENRYLSSKIHEQPPILAGLIVSRHVLRLAANSLLFGTSIAPCLAKRNYIPYRSLGPRPLLNVGGGLGLVFHGHLNHDSQSA